MAEGEESWQESEDPRALRANMKSLLGLLPAIALFSLAYASLTEQTWWESSTALGYVWAMAGTAVVVESVIGVRMVDAGEKNGGTSLVMFGWACSNALLGVGFFFGGELPHNAWLGFGYAVITIALIQMGATFVVWDALTGIFGAYAKAIAIAMGSAAIVISVVLNLILSTNSGVYY
jgi:hypothetical protein